MRLELESVEDRRVVTGGYHYATDRALLLHRKGDGGCRRRLGRENHFEIISGEDLCGCVRESIGKEPAIVTNDHAPLGSLDGIGRPIIGSRLSNALNVGESEILRNY